MQNSEGTRMCERVGRHLLYKEELSAINLRKHQTRECSPPKPVELGRTIS